jgi:hypothetical protein
MAGWKGIGRMKHRVRRVDLGDLVRYRPQGAVSTVYGVWLDDGRFFVLLRLSAGQAWVPSQDCDSLDQQGVSS